MTTDDTTFGASFGSIFMSGVRGYFRNPWPLTVASAATLGVYLAFRFPAQSAADNGDVGIAIALDLIGLVVAATVALPWYGYALNAYDGKQIDIGFPFRNTQRFQAQAVASFWFWAGVLLGLRYLLGLPSIVAALFYAFYGFVIADGQPGGGLMALGTSARIGTGKRVGLFALGALFVMFNFFGAISLGFAVNPLTIAIALIGLVVTTNITMVAGAGVYRLVQSSAKSRT